MVQHQHTVSHVLERHGSNRNFDNNNHDSSSSKGVKNKEKTVGLMETKKFTADNGVRYVWDTEEDCWVVDESGDQSDDDDGDDNNNNNNNKNESDEENDDDDGDDSEEEHKQSTTTATTATKRKRKKRAKKPVNNWVYISGLPLDVTTTEIKEHFGKVGLIALYPSDQSLKIKLYRDQDGNFKGDAMLCYHASESVEMAVNYLDGGYIRPTHKIEVVKADFEKINQQYPQQQQQQEQGGNVQQQQLQKKSKTFHAKVKVTKSAMNQLLSWNEDDDIGVSNNNANILKIVILQHMFSPTDFISNNNNNNNGDDDDESSDNAVKELEEEIGSECSKCGNIEKLTVCRHHPLGIVIVKFSTAYASQQCIQLMNGRYFDKRQIKAFYWDGVTDYTSVRATTTTTTTTGGRGEGEIARTSLSAMDSAEMEEAKRLDEFGDWLEQQQEDLPEEFHLRTK